MGLIKYWTEKQTNLKTLFSSKQKKKKWTVRHILYSTHMGLVKYWTEKQTNLETLFPSKQKN